MKSYNLCVLASTLMYVIGLFYINKQEIYYVKILNKLGSGTVKLLKH